MNDNVNSVDFARSNPSYMPKKRMPGGLKAALIVISIVLVFAILFGLLGATILGFFGIVIGLIIYLTMPKNDGTLEYRDYNGGIEILGFVDNDFSGDLHIPEEIDGKRVTSIGFEAFASSNVEVVYLPDTIEYIYGYAFYDCKHLREVYMSDNVTYMGTNVFDFCKNLEYVKLSEKLTYIDNYSFMHCTSLEMIKIPASVTYISEDTFYGCENLREVYFEDSYGWSVSYYYADEFKPIKIPEDELNDPLTAAELINQYNDYYWKKSAE